jgi:hypothetical protein
MTSAISAHSLVRFVREKRFVDVDRWKTAFFQVPGSLGFSRCPSTGMRPALTAAIKRQHRP